MIPYFQFTTISLGPITIQVWGLMVSLGIMAGIAAVYLLAQKFSLSTNVVLDMAIWAVIGGLLGGRIFFVLFYSPEHFLQYPLDVLKFWQGGASSLGGFAGAFVAILLYLKKYHLTFREILPYLDIMSLGLWLGWGIGRLGCFLIHDHIGRLSNFFMAVNFPGGARHDLGLYDSILGFILLGIYLLLSKKLIRTRAGLLAACSFISYAVIRFFLDFLRATDLAYVDVRYAGLTPAQWGMLAITIALTFFIFRSKIVKQN